MATSDDEMDNSDFPLCQSAVLGQKYIISHKRQRETSHQGIIKRALNTWVFHNNCGKNIVLSSNGQTAEVKNSNNWQNGVLISTELMSTNKLYEIQVEETDTRYFGAYIVIGICEENPQSIKLPKVSSQIKTFVGVHAFGSIRHWSETKEYSCPALMNVKVGSRLGVMVDTSHSLHVYVDGKDQGVVGKNVAQECYAIFDLHYFIKKVSTLPVSSIQ